MVGFGSVRFPIVFNAARTSEELTRVRRRSYHTGFNVDITIFL